MLPESKPYPHIKSLYNAESFRIVAYRPSEPIERCVHVGYGGTVLAGDFSALPTEVFVLYEASDWTSQPYFAANSCALATSRSVNSLS